MDPTQTQQPMSYKDFLTAYTPNMEIGPFLLDLGLACVCCYILAMIYVRFGRSLSNRASLARNFVAVGMTTMLIIAIVKSSLALSLGLVGALSIVRFRTAIKEPEELAYLFVTISVGLGFGASQREITLVGFGAIAVVLCLRGLLGGGIERGNLYFIVSSRGPKKVALEQITSTLQTSCPSLSLKRFDENGDSLEASYRVSFSDYRQLESAKRAIQGLGESVAISFVDNDEVG